MPTTPVDISSVAPLFVVRDVTKTQAFYRDQLGFEVTFRQPEDQPFFGIVQRGGAMVMLKSVDVDPLPNAVRHPWLNWDAYFYVSDPDSLAAEFQSRGIAFAEHLQNTQDNLRGFKVKDPDGYVLFFGRPRA